MRGLLFTVIITTYNRKALLPRAIRSVLKQTLSDLELLVIDNGSTDGTPDVVKGISDERVIYILNPNPSDSCDAPRNLGIAKARGRLIAFLDDDDIWYPERLAKVKKAFDDNPDVSAVCHNEYRIENGQIQDVIKYGPWTEDFHEKLLYEGNRLSSCGTTVKAEVLRGLGGFDARRSFSGAADYEFWIRMTSAGNKIYFIDEPLGEFTVTGQNYSSRDASFNEKIYAFVKMHILRYEERPAFSLSRRGMRRLFMLHLLAARSYTTAKDYVNAARHCIAASLFVVRRPSLVSEIFVRLRKR